jgi:hypothetical protein
VSRDELYLPYPRRQSPRRDDHLVLSQEAYDQIFGPFDRGEFRELTEQEWQALIDGERKSPHDAESLALPPKEQDG